MQYKRIMAIDYGDVRIGIAQTDLLQVIASPLTVINNTNQEKSLQQIAQLIDENSVETVVFGLPLNMDGSEGERVVVTRAFANELAKKTSAKIVFQDERLSSAEAEDIMHEAHLSSKNRKKVIDKIAASIILESYLNRKER